VELQQTKDNKEELELVLEQVKLETKDEKDHVDRLEQGLVVAYEKIPKSAQTTELTMTCRRLIRLCRQSINTGRRSSTSENNSYLPLPRGEGEEEAGSNNTDRGDGATSQRSC
jgi:hypothetical protein